MSPPETRFVVIPPPFIWPVGIDLSLLHECGPWRCAVSDAMPDIESMYVTKMGEVDACRCLTFL